MAERVQVRDLAPSEGQKLLGIVRRGSGSVVRWRRAQIVLWSAQRTDVLAIAKIAFTSEDRLREVIHNFNADGFESLVPRYAGAKKNRILELYAIADGTTAPSNLSTKTDQRVAEWAAANNVELVDTPTYSSWLNRIEAQFQAVRYFALDGTDHASHREQASMIRRYIHWRNRNAHDRSLRELMNRANVA